MGVCNCSMFCCTLLCVPSSCAIILMGKRELVTLLSLSSWCLVVTDVVWLFLAVPWVCLQFVIVEFPDHTHLLFLKFGHNRFREHIIFMNFFNIIVKLDNSCVYSDCSNYSFTRIKFRTHSLDSEKRSYTTVLPTKSDSDVIFCLQSLSKHYFVHST